MPIYFFWGSDEFRLKQAITDLKAQTLDSAWASFNYDKIPPDQPDAVIQALNQAMTPPFGLGQRLVWLQDTALGQRCSEALLAELLRTLPVIPETTVLLLTSAQKPDGRLKSTKLLQKHAAVREFSLIPPWKTDLLIKQVRQVARELALHLTPEAAELLAVAVGADTRRLYGELDKLKLYWGERQEPLPADAVTALVVTSTQNSLQLAAALRQGDTAQALALATDLLGQNEPALRIVATLVGQFRTWLWVKLMAEERDPQVVARAAEVSNPKRIYFLRKEVQSLRLDQLQQALRGLLALEWTLKQGAPEQITVQTKIIELADGLGAR